MSAPITAAPEVPAMRPRVRNRLLELLKPASAEHLLPQLADAAHRLATCRAIAAVVPNRRESLHALRQLRMVACAFLKSEPPPGARMHRLNVAGHSIDALRAMLDSFIGWPAALLLSYEISIAPPWAIARVEGILEQVPPGASIGSMLEALIAGLLRAEEAIPRASDWWRLGTAAFELDDAGFPTRTLAEIAPVVPIRRGGVDRQLVNEIIGPLIDALRAAKVRPTSCSEILALVANVDISTARGWLSRRPR